MQHNYPRLYLQGYTKPTNSCRNSGIVRSTYASFKISASMQGQDALILAGEQLIDGLSVGVDVNKSVQKKDYLYVTSATSLVSNAAASGKVFKINSIVAANVDGTSAADITINVYSAAALGGTAFPIASTISVPADVGALI